MPPLRTICALLAFTVLGGLLAVGLAAAQNMANQEVIVDGDNASPRSVKYQDELSPLIDRQTFFGDPARSGAQISPDREQVSFLTPHKGVMNVWVKERGQANSLSQPFDSPTMTDGAHDLLALDTMLLEPGFSTSLQVFGAQQQTVRTAHFEVTGTAHLRKALPHHVAQTNLEQSPPRGTRTISQTLSEINP